jgi:hypothetical protein
MEGVEIARELIVQSENISIYKVSYRRPDGFVFECVTSIIVPKSQHDWGKKGGPATEQRSTPGP